MRFQALCAATLLSTLLATPALAEPTCSSLDAAVSELRDKYNERLTHRAISLRGYMVMLFATEDGATWTMLGMLPDGKTVCQLDAGQALQAVAPGDQPADEGEGL